MNVSFSTSAAEGQDTLEPYLHRTLAPLLARTRNPPDPDQPRDPDSTHQTSSHRPVRLDHSPALRSPRGIQTAWDALVHLFAPHVTAPRQRLDFKADFAKAVTEVNEA